jgi:hypothetical protein
MRCFAGQRASAGKYVGVVRTALLTQGFKGRVNARLPAFVLCHGQRHRASPDMQR